MKSVSLAFAALLCCSRVFASGPVGAEVRLDFQAVGVAQVIGLVYMDAIPSPYVIAPDVLQDARVVSFRYSATNGDVHGFWRSFLDSLGYVVETRGGVDFIGPKKVREEPGPAREVFVYRPLHRSVRYLVDLMGGIFGQGAFLAQRGVKASSADTLVATAPPEGSASALLNGDSDVLLFNGTAEEIARFKSIVPALDVPTGEVVVKAIVYEVTTGRNEASALSLAVSILGGRLGLSVGAAGRFEDALTIRSGSIDAAISAFKGDTRFKAVSTPSVRVKSGKSAKLMVGQDVPTIGSLSYPQGGTVPVQSVEYRSSGVIFNLVPTVRDGGIDVQVDQQISDFARTESGVNNSPTLTKRSLSTTVGMQDGELVVLGGLTQEKKSVSDGGQSFLPQFMRSKESNDSRTEVLLLLQVSKVMALN